MSIIRLAIYRIRRKVAIANLRMLIRRHNRSRKIHAFGIALANLVSPLKINKRNGKARFTGARVPAWLSGVLAPFFDLRRTRTGSVYIHLRARNRG